MSQIEWIYTISWIAFSVVVVSLSTNGRHFDRRLSGAKEMPMRKSRFTESQIVEILKQGEAGVPIAEILRQHNISKATYFQWRAKYAGASIAELKRLKELEAENAKLKDVCRTRPRERGHQGCP